MATALATACILLSVLMLRKGLCYAAKTAYLLSSMQQSNPANDTYITLPEILQPPNNGVYDTIVLLANYTNMPGEQALLVANQNLTITSAAGRYHTFTFNYITGAVTISKANITFKNLATYKTTRKTTGQAIPFFQGDGKISFQSVVRSRIGCAVPVSVTFQTLVASNRPAAFPGHQTIEYVDLYHQGRDYPHSIHLVDFAYFVGPSDIDEFQSYKGYYLTQQNVTRACLSYISEQCLHTDTSDACFQQAVDLYLAQEAAAQAGPAVKKDLKAVIVGPVVAGVVVLIAAVLGLLWHSRQRRRHTQQLPVTAHGPHAKQQQSVQLQQQPPSDEKDVHREQPDVRNTERPSGYLGAVGTIKEVAFGCTGTKSSEWNVLASHTAPQFTDATPEDKVTLGVLLGAGSFGRVYKARWRGLDVAVKVLQHDSTSGATVANEVDLFMSFRHPNVTQAYHFVTWKRLGIHSNDAAARQLGASAKRGKQPPSSLSSSNTAASKPTECSSSSTTPHATAFAEARASQLNEQQSGQQQADSGVPGDDVASIRQVVDDCRPVSASPNQLQPSAAQQEGWQLQSKAKAACYSPAGRQLSLQQLDQRQPPVGSSCNMRDDMRSNLSEAQTWLILEYCDGGTLLDIIEGQQLIEKSTGKVILAHVLTLLCDIASGMLYLHSRNVLHGDLKPGNVLLKRQQGAPYGQRAKITDFGLSRSLNAGQSHHSTQTIGSVNHTPPELLRLGRFHPASDVYAFAIMMWELYTGKVAWKGMHYGEVFERVAFKQERPPVPDDMPEAYAKLMVSGWSSDPFLRPTFGMILDRLQQQLAGMVIGQQDAEDRFVADL